MRSLAVASSIAISCLMFGQQPDPSPQFEAADVRLGAKSLNPSGRSGAVRGERYEIKAFTMVDLIQAAYAYPNDRVLEGPNWIEMDRYDVTAKMPAGTKPEARRQMLQALLADRFKLVIRKEDRPMPSYALMAGKKPLLKLADGLGETGCKPKTASGPPGEGGMRIGINGVQIALGPGAVIEFNCRNMSMADFAQGLRGMFVADLGQNPVPDETGLKGIWNFDVRWSLGFIGLPMDSGDHISPAEAIDKQLGLKLEQRQVPTPVIVVESVNRKPSENPHGTAEALPPLKALTEFEVADVKPSAPGGRGGGLRNQPGGRVTGQGVAMRQLLMRAFNSFNDEGLAGVPEWSNMERFDINAEASTDSAPGSAQSSVDQETFSLMLRSLLADRFKMKWHTEDRPLTAYTLVAVKPKIRKADPKERASCKTVPAPAGSPPGSESLACQDVTMEQFADRLQGMGQGLNWPVTDSTELEGAWDFNLTWNRFPMMMAPGRGGDAGIPGSPVPSASEPSNSVTIFEAVEKQLGLKLSPRKRNMPVVVIDHLEQKPTEN